MISILGAAMTFSGALGCLFFGSAVLAEMREVFDGKRLSGPSLGLELFATFMCAFLFAGGIAVMAA